MRHSVFILVFVAAVISGCRNDVATPRQLAFPRIVTCDTIYHPVDNAVIPIDINTSAVVDVTNRGRWIDAYYPTYHGKLSLTLDKYRHSDSIRAAIDNRVERMSINVGDFTAEQTDLHSPDGVHSVILVTSAGCVTPVQFLATDRRRLLVSGSFSFDNPVTKHKADSLAPVIDALRSDIIRLVNSIHPENIK